MEHDQNILSLLFSERKLKVQKAMNWVSDCQGAKKLRGKSQSLWCGTHVELNSTELNIHDRQSFVSIQFNWMTTMTMTMKWRWPLDESHNHYHRHSWNGKGKEKNWQMKWNGRMQWRMQWRMTDIAWTGLCLQGKERKGKERKGKERSPIKWLPNISKQVSPKQQEQQHGTRTKHIPSHNWSWCEKARDSELHWIELHSIELSCIQLNWIELNWIELNWVNQLSESIEWTTVNTKSNIRDKRHAGRCRTGYS